jgi:hypothetical protein
MENTKQSAILYNQYEILKKLPTEDWLYPLRNASKICCTRISRITGLILRAMTMIIRRDIRFVWDVIQTVPDPLFERLISQADDRKRRNHYDALSFYVFDSYQDTNITVTAGISLKNSNDFQITIKRKPDRNEHCPTLRKYRHMWTVEKCQS